MGFKFNAGKLPSIPDVDVEMAKQRYMQTHADHSELIDKVMRGAVTLREICLDNYNEGGHRFYETMDLFHWYDFQCRSYCDSDYPQTQGSFAFYVLNHKTVAKAAKAMVKDLMMYDDYATDIEGTAF